MTIRLLSTYDGFTPQSIITLDSALEASLIAGGNATATLTGGTVAYRERQPVMIQPAVPKRGTVSLIANRKAIVPLTEGSALTITPTAGTTGAYQRYDASGAAVGALTTIGATQLTIGAFEGDFTVEIKCTTGSLVAKTSDAVVGAPVVGSTGGLTASDGSAVQSLVPQLPAMYTGLMKVLAKTGRADLAYTDDSTGVGTITGGGPKYLNGARAVNPAAQLVKQLNAAGIPAANDSFFGEMLLQAFNSTNYTDYETRFTLSGGATFIASGGFQSLGGIPWQLNSAGKALNFTPDNAVDTVDIYVLNRNVGTIDVTFAGGASAGAITTNGTQTVSKVTRTFTRGSGVASISWVSGNVIVLGAVFTDSTTPRVNILNLSSYGDRWNSPNGNVYNTTVPESRGGAVLALMGLTAVIASMTINSQTIDGINGIPVFETALRGYCDYVAAANAQLLLLAPHRISTASAPEATQAAYVAAQYRVAQDYKAPVIDFSKRINSFAAFPAMFVDDKHLTATGSAAKARTILPYILQ